MVIAWHALEDQDFIVEQTTCAMILVDGLLSLTAPLKLSKSAPVVAQRVNTLTVIPAFNALLVRTLHSVALVAALAAALGNLAAQAHPPALILALQAQPQMQQLYPVSLVLQVNIK